jgi:hypothetical protein
MFAASILTGLIVSFLSSYYLTKHMRETMQTHEGIMNSYKDLAFWYFEKEQAREKKTVNSVPNGKQRK